MGAVVSNSALDTTTNGSNLSELTGCDGFGNDSERIAEGQRFLAKNSFGTGIDGLLDEFEVGLRPGADADDLGGELLEKHLGIKEAFGIGELVHHIPEGSDAWVGYGDGVAKARFDVPADVGGCDSSCAEDRNRYRRSIICRFCKRDPSQFSLGSGNNIFHVVSCENSSAD